MTKEVQFLIYCIERYRYHKQLSGEEAARFFEKYQLYDYIIRYFESLHTMGDLYIIQYIDDYIKGLAEPLSNSHNHAQ